MENTEKMGEKTKTNLKNASLFVMLCCVVFCYFGAQKHRNAIL